MDSKTKSEDSWNTVNKKRYKNKNENDIIMFFKKIKEELDNEFSFLQEKNNCEVIKEEHKKKHKKDNKKQEFKSQNIFSLLLEDSE